MHKVDFSESRNSVMSPRLGCASLDIRDLTHPLRFLASQDWHEASYVGRWKLNLMFARMQDCLVNSEVRDGSEFPRPFRATVRSAVFRLDVNLFACAVDREDPKESAVTVMVWAESAARASQTLVELREKYAAAPHGSRPQFNVFSVSGFGVDKLSIDLRRSSFRSPADLALHYGADFNAWNQRFLKALRSRKSGISILRGEPGTGKTSYVRHLIAKLRRTHRFYYLPVTEFHLLSSSTMVQFWLAENSQADAASKAKVVIIEDAEALVAERAGDNQQALSNLLNIADGLLGDFLRLHVICTLNIRLERLDAAIRRPARLVELREFRRLNAAEAQALARKRRVELPAGRDYSLAEIYQLGSGGCADGSREHRIGFSHAS